MEHNEPLGRRILEYLPGFKSKELLQTKNQSKNQINQKKKKRAKNQAVRTEALWLSLYCMKCKHHAIALLYRYELAIVVEAIVGETTTTQRWRSRCRDDDDGNHDDALEMEVKSKI